MKRLIQIQDIDITELQETIANTVKAEVFAIKEILMNGKSNNNDDLLTPDQVCELLGISKVTLWNYQKNNKLKAYGIGQKRYYKRADVLNAIQLKNFKSIL